MFIDTHAHMYLDQFEGDIDTIIESCKENEVGRIYLPNIERNSIEPMMELTRKAPELFYPMMGLHPCSVKSNFMDELAYMELQLDQHDFAAIGEIGIDLYWDKSMQKEQEIAFRMQIEWAKRKNLPFVIHSRESLDETISTVQELQDGSLKGIFHCFTGTEDQAKKIINLGFYLGIGGVLTFKNSDLKNVVKEIGPGHLVLETDAPFLAPVPHRGKRNQSDYIPIIANFLAEQLKISVEEVAIKTTANAIELFG
jgi:TatD DNase family protein